MCNPLCVSHYTPWGGSREGEQDFTLSGIFPELYKVLKQNLVYRNKILRDTYLHKNFVLGPTRGVLWGCGSTLRNFNFLTVEIPTL